MKHRKKDRLVPRHRTVDTLPRMHAAGTIDAAMVDAGRQFQRTFALAQLDPLRAVDLLRVPGGGNASEPGMAALRAREHVHRALIALGGPDSPAGSCVWHVLGYGRSVREWALSQGWSGRPLRQEQAQGILVAALGMLAAYSAHGWRKRPGDRAGQIEVPRRELTTRRDPPLPGPLGIFR